MVAVGSVVNVAVIIAVIGVPRGRMYDVGRPSSVSAICLQKLEATNAMSEAIAADER